MATNLSLAKRVYVIVSLILAGTALMALVTWTSMQGLAHASRRLGEVNLSSVATLYEVSHYYEQQNALVNRAPAQTDLKALQKMLESFQEANLKLDGHIAELKKVDAQGSLSAALKAFEAELPALRQCSTNVFSLSAQFQQLEATTLLQTKANAMQDRAGNRLNEAMEKALAAANVQPGLIVKQAGRANSLILGLCLGVFVVSLGVSVVFVRRGIVRPVRAVADTLAATFEHTVEGVQEIARGSQSLAEGASEQASSLEETSASLEELSSMTTQNTESSQRADQLVKQARNSAENGVKEMQAMTQAMEAIKVSSDDIAKIIKTIDEIAFQTNILALNAAVEAARAGEAGMGFAVVADEVRNLAQRSAQAAKETSDKIQGAIARTGQGVDISSKVATALQDILTKVREVDEIASQVAHASREQSQGITQINAAIGQVDKVTQANAAHAEESASAATQLEDQANSLKQAMQDLVALVEGGDRSVKAEHVPAATAAPAHPVRQSKATPQRTELALH